MKNNQYFDFNGTKLTNIDSITINRNPILDDEVSNKKYVDDELNKKTTLRFNQTLENYLKISVDNDTYKSIENDKMQITETTNIKTPNSGGYLLHKWLKNVMIKITMINYRNFIKSTKTNSSKSHSGETSFPPIGESFMYIETSTDSHANNVFVSWVEIDVLKITNTTLLYTRYTNLTNDSLKSKGRVRIQLLLADNTWCIRYNMKLIDIVIHQLIGLH